MIVMERTVSQVLVEWKNHKARKPLVVNGARQVGKTWLLREFARREYRQEAYVNCRRNDLVSQRRFHRIQRWDDRAICASTNEESWHWRGFLPQNWRFAFGNWLCHTARGQTSAHQGEGGRQCAGQLSDQLPKSEPRHPRHPILHAPIQGAGTDDQCAAIRGEVKVEAPTASRSCCRTSARTQMPTHDRCRNATEINH